MLERNTLQGRQYRELQYASMVMIMTILEGHIHADYSCVAIIALLMITTESSKKIHPTSDTAIRQNTIETETNGFV